MDNLSRNHYLILAYLYGDGNDNPTRAITVSEIRENYSFDEKIPTIKRYLYKLCELGYVAIGLPQWKAKTYYITEKGTSIVESNKRKEK